MAADKSEPIYIITGASKGIGFETLKYLCTIPGYIITVSRTIPDELSKILNENQKKICHFLGNIDDPEVADVIIDTVEKRGGKIDALIHNAALAPVAQIKDIDVDIWKKLFDVNFFSIVDLTQKALPYLRKAKGRVIFVSSGASVKPMVGWSTYCTSKACVNMYAKVLSKEEPDIYTIALRPGVVNTPMQEYVRNNCQNGFTKEDCEYVIGLEKKKQLRDPKEPASILFNLAQLSKKVPEDCNGEFVSIDDKRLASFKTFVTPKN